MHVSILRKGKPVLTAEEAYAAASHLREFLLSYVHLAHCAVAGDQAFFKCRPKLHCIDHICRNLVVSRENPRYHEVWLEEDLLGRLSKVLKLTHDSGNGLRAMQRWVLGLWEQWYVPKE